MGASCWHYFTPYDPDPEAALQRLRQDVFANHQYSDHYRVGLEFAEHLDKTFSEPGSEERLSRQDRELVRAVQNAIDDAPRGLRWLMKLSMQEAARRPKGEPQSIDELLELAEEEGTHSILDITHVAKRKESGAAFPAPDKLLLEFFGTTQPTRAQVEEYAIDLCDEVDRWEAYYLVVYKDGQPHEYAFVGSSGD